MCAQCLIQAHQTALFHCIQVSNAAMTSFSILITTINIFYRFGAVVFGRRRACLPLDYAFSWGMILVNFAIVLSHRQVVHLLWWI
jgi:hypothetical protein